MYRVITYTFARNLFTMYSCVFYEIKKSFMQAMIRLDFNALLFVRLLNGV
jgi:hypothetical protein